jgi:hypothetical protein
MECLRGVVFTFFAAGIGVSGGGSSGNTGSVNSSGYQGGNSNSTRPAIPK